MNIQVTNLNQSLIEADLQRLFTPYGELGSVLIIRDKHNNRSSGKAIIDMPVEREARNAIEGLNQIALAGKTIAVCGISYKEELGKSSSFYRTLGNVDRLKGQ